MSNPEDPNVEEEVTENQEAFVEENPLSNVPEQEKKPESAEQTESGQAQPPVMTFLHNRLIFSGQTLFEANGFKK